MDQIQFQEIIDRCRKIRPDDISAITDLLFEASKMPPLYEEVLLKHIKTSTGISLMALRQHSAKMRKDRRKPSPPADR